jgi:excisionase family DNA binding protein
MGTIKENYEIMFTSYPDLVDISQLKEMLGIGITLAYRLVRENTIKALKVGRQYKIPKANVIAYLTNQI